MKGNYRNQSNETVFICLLLIVVCYAGLLYTWINQLNDEAEAYGSQPWSSAFNAAGGAPQSIAPISNTFFSSSPAFTYPHRSARGIHISSGGGVHRFGVPVPTGGTGFRVYNSAGAGVSGNAYAFRTTTGSAGGSASGFRLTSDAVLHSYGGGNAAGSGMQGASSQSRATQGNATGGSLSAPVLTVSLPTYTLAYTPSTSLTADPDQQAAAAAMASAQWQQHTSRFGSGALFSSPISNPYRTVNGVSSFLSADEYLANSNGNSASSRYRAPGTIDPIEQWLKSLIAQGLGGYSGQTDGTYYFDLAALKAYYEALIAGNNMPGFTWEEILTWFNTQEGTKTFDFNPLPVGEPWVLLILAVLYAVYLLWRRLPRFDKCS